MSKKNQEQLAEQAAEQTQVQAAEAQPTEAQPAEKQEEQPADETPAEEQPAETADRPKYDIVVCAYPGTEEKMAALWKRALGPKEFLIVTAGVAVEGETPLESVAEELPALAEALLARDDVADGFILVCPNTFPTHALSEADVATPVVYVDAKGNRTFAHKLPAIMEKETIATLLAEKEFWNPEEFAKRAQEALGVFPIEVGMSFGNYVTNVLRATPCENKVIEALIKKKFITCSPDGWRGIAAIVDKFLSE